MRLALTENKALISHLSCDYILLRVILVSFMMGIDVVSPLTKKQAWRQGRPDIAKLMLAKVGTLAEPLSPALKEQSADVAFEIGKGQMKAECYSEARDWLGYAYNSISGQDIEVMSSDAGDLKLSIMHNLVRVLVHLSGDDHRERAWSLFREVEIDHGELLAVLLLKLDLLATEPFVSPQQSSDVMQQIINKVHLTDSNMNTILYHIHKLRSWSGPLAHEILMFTISKILLGGEQKSWLEKMLVTVVWNCTSSSDILDPVLTLTQSCNAIAAGWGYALSLSAMHAAQVLLWKCIESAFKRQQYGVSEAWCKLALHKIFSSSGAMNIGRLQRKSMLCALSQAQPGKAREIFAQMSEFNRKEPSSQHLLYKVALSFQDSNMAMVCLDSICRASLNDMTSLYACILEAQKVDDQISTVAALQQLLEKYDRGANHSFHLPALLRCTARLLLRRIKEHTVQTDSILNDICRVFERSAEHAKKSPCTLQDSLFTVAELEWFSRNSYNLCIKNCSLWPPQSTARLIASCLQFIDLYPLDSNLSIIADLGLRRLLCHFVSGCLSITRARKESVSAARLQYYLDVRSEVEAFRVQFQYQIESVGEGARFDLQRKHTSLLAYDFEAAAFLKAWESLQVIIKVLSPDHKRCPDPLTLSPKECQVYGNAQVFASLADIILASEAPADSMCLGCFQFCRKLTGLPSYCKHTTATHQCHMGHTRQ